MKTELKHLQNSIRIKKSMFRTTNANCANYLQTIEKEISKILLIKNVVPISVARIIKKYNVNAEKYYFIGKDGGYKIVDKPKKMTRNYYPAIYLEDLPNYFYLLTNKPETF